MDVFLFVVIGLSIRASWIDARFGILPNRINFWIFVLALLWVLTTQYDFDLFFYIGVLLVHLGLVLWPRAGLGAGDLKLVMGQGLVTANLNRMYLWLLLAYGFAAIWGLLHLKNQNIRFGPWLTSALLVVVMGELTHVAMAYSR